MPLRPFVNALPGDITQVPADAIITAINSGAMWFGGIDNAIRRAAGDLFHARAYEALPLSHGETIYAPGDGTTSFKDVVFVIDDLEGPLGDIIYNGLMCAAERGAKNVTIPTLRMGVMHGAVEQTTDEVIDQMVAAIKRYQESGTGDLHRITFVVYNDFATHRLFIERIAQEFGVV